MNVNAPLKVILKIEQNYALTKTNQQQTYFITFKICKKKGGCKL
jgi:hypothetical protein